MFIARVGFTFTDDVFKLDLSNIGNGELNLETSGGIVDVIREPPLHRRKVTNKVHRGASNSVPRSDGQRFDRKTANYYKGQRSKTVPSVPCLLEGLEAGVRGPFGRPILMALRISGGRELYPVPCPRLFDLINALRFMWSTIPACPSPLKNMALSSGTPSFFCICLTLARLRSVSSPRMHVIPVLEPDLNTALRHPNALRNQFAHLGIRALIDEKRLFENTELVWSRPLTFLVELLHGHARSAGTTSLAACACRRLGARGGR